MSTLTQKVKVKAHDLGFDLVGVTNSQPPPHVDAYKRWLSLGRHGGMAYLATQRAVQRRADPRKILPECQSIIVVAANYTNHAEQTLDEPLQTRVAAYARGQDYHDVLTDRLKKLVDTIQKHSPQPILYRIYTDTGPLLERELAQRAGLGWIGKNTCLINPNIGSYIFIAQMLVSIQLELDEPFLSDRCGTCTRCIDACPTACILPDRTLDARQCISYLTIEEKGSVPTELRQAVGGWIFGCDVCQLVCPWNKRFARRTSDLAFQPRPFILESDVERFLTLSPETWRHHLRGSSLERAKRHGLLRNAAIVAGNQNNPKALPALAKLLLSEPEPLVRAHAAWALGRIGGQQAVRTLNHAQGIEEDINVIEEIREALSIIANRSQTSI